MIDEIFSHYLKKRNSAAARMFGSDGVMVNGNVMMFEWKGALVLRLNEGDADEALKLKGASYFNPMDQGNPSRNWVAIPVDALDSSVFEFADSAYRFAAALPPKAKKSAGKKVKPKPKVKAKASTKKKSGKLKKVPAKKVSVKAAKKKPVRPGKKATPKKAVKKRRGKK